MSRVASGGQAEADRGVRRGAQPGGDVQHRATAVDAAEPGVSGAVPGARAPRQALGLSRGQVAVGDDGAVARDGELAAVCLPECLAMTTCRLAG